MLISGKLISQKVLDRLTAQPKPQKFLAAILVGDDASSISFLKQKEKTAQKLGIEFKLFQFPEAIEKNELAQEIKKLGDDPKCGGVILQLPLPDRSIEQEMLDVIPQEKDVDVLSAAAQGAFQTGESMIFPPPVGVVLECLNDYFPNPTATFSFIISSTIAVVGAGRLVGQPIAKWLIGKAKEVIVLDRGDDLAKLKTANLIISGAGVPGLITPDMISENAIVIDFGYGAKDGKTMGDFDPAQLATPDSPIAYTPTPGGTGPILVAKLFENFYKLNAEIVI